MRLIVLLVFILASASAFSQNDTLTLVDIERELTPLKTSIESLESANSTLSKEIVRLNSRLYTANATIDSLEKRIEVNSNAINQTATQLGLEISNTEVKANQKIENVSDSLNTVSDSLSKNSLYGIIGVLLAILISGIIYWLLSKKQKADKTNIIDQLGKTKSSIEESLVKEFGKQTELMDTHLQLIIQQKAKVQAEPNSEPDHSLALKVASEINLIERNINLMDAGTKGLKQLVRSVEKLKDNLAANGYEMPELLGVQIHQGMKVIITSSLPVENLEKDSEVITKVLIPQVNYNDKMIQTAQIEVSVGN